MEAMCMAPAGRQQDGARLAKRQAVAMGLGGYAMLAAGRRAWSCMTPWLRFSLTRAEAAESLVTHSKHETFSYDAHGRFSRLRA